MDKKKNPYAGHRYPPEIICHAVWGDFRFTLRFRDVEEILASRGVIVSDEAIRQWTRKFCQAYANSLRRRYPRRGDTWHLDEVVFTMNGRHHTVLRKEHAASSLMKDQKRPLCISPMTGMPHATRCSRSMPRTAAFEQVCLPGG